METGEKFKKAVIGGFDKTDVMNYFEKTQKKHREEIQALKNELNRQGGRIQSLQDQCGEQSETISDLKVQLSAAEENGEALSLSNSALQKKNEALQRELSAQKAVGTELQMKKNVLEENLRQETEKNAELKAELDDLTARFAERTGIEIGELLIEAKVNARKIIEKPKADAEQIRTEIGGECGEAEKRFSGLNDQLGSVEEHFRAVSEETIAGLEAVRKELSEVQISIAFRSDEMEKKTKALNADQSMIPEPENFFKKENG